MPATRSHGTVTSAGKPVAAARVVWRGVDGGEYATITDASGHYDVADPSKWAASVVVLHADFAPSFAARPRGDDRRSAAFRMPVDFQLERGRAVEGVCRTGEGTAVPNAAISVDGWPFGRAAADGTFALAHVPSSSRFVEGRVDAFFGRAEARGNSVVVIARPAVSLRGQVTDSANAPVSGAELIVSAMNGAEAPRSAITAADGTFELPSFAAGERQLEVTAPGFDVATQQIRIDGRPLALRASRLASVAGRVVDEDGKPVAGSRVVAVPAVTRGPMRIDVRNVTYSADDGSFTVDEVPAGRMIRLAASRSGFEPASTPQLELKPGQAKSGVEIRALRAVTLTGRIVDDKSVGIAGAVVTLRDRGETPTEVSPARTSADGNFSINLPRGRYAVTVERDGFAPRDLPEFLVKDASSVLEVTLHAAVALRGVITEGSAPVAGFAVSAGRERAVTAADGSFVLGNLEAGDVIVATRDVNGFLRDKRTVPAPGFATIDVPSAARIRGRVIDSVSGAPVRVFSVTMQIAAGGATRLLQKNVNASDGAFDLPGLPPGRLRMMVDAEGYARSEAPERAIAAGETVSDLELAVTKSAMLYGTVTDESGAGVDGAMVSVSPSGSRRGVEATTDSAGHYSVPNVARGAATVVVQSDAFQPETLQVGVSGETRRDVVLKSGAHLRGSVVTDRNTPAGGARVVVQFAGGSRSAMSDDAGAFDVAGLTQGPFTVITSKAGYAMTRREVARLDEPVVIALQSAGVIAGRVSIPPGAISPILVTAANPQGVASAQASPDGTFRVDGAPTGEVQVTAQVEFAAGTRRTPTKSVHVVGEGEVWVELAMQ